MKLRLRGNSVRLRLTKREVANLVGIGLVEESLHAGPGPDDIFRYRLEAGGDHPRVHSRLEQGALIVQVPVAAAADWANSAKVGLYAEMPWGLKIAIEKDFRCLDATRPEDESDSFDHPGIGLNLTCVPNPAGESAG